MKKTGFFTLFFIFLCVGVWAVDYTWTGGAGGGDTDWTNPANWDDGTSYPGSDPTNDTVIINSGSGTVTLDNEIVLTSLTIDNADLDLGVYSLEVGTLTIKNNANILNLDSTNLTVNTLFEVEGTTFDLNGCLLTVDTLRLVYGAELTGNLTADNITIDDYSTFNSTISFSGGGVLVIDGTNTVSITGSDIVCGNLDLGSRNVSVTQTGSGGITQNPSTVIKTLRTLSLSTDGAITLMGDNDVAVLEITGAGGAVEFTNSVALGVAGINGVVGNSVTITTNGSLTVSGNIEVGGAVTITVTGTGSYITQNPSTVIETSGKLSLDAAGAITLTEANKVAVLEITGAGGAVHFTNSVGLEVAGITADDSVTITTNGDITVSGNIEVDGAVTITVTGTGSDITQNPLTVIETSGTLSLNAAGAITLTEANKVTKLEITGAGGAVQFTNSVALNVTGISGVGNNDVTITVTTGGLNVNVINAGGDITFEANADITVGTGGITVTGVVKLEAAGGNITVSGKITAYQLIAKAPSNTVSINAVDIAFSNTGNELENAAIYIYADRFVVTTTTPNSIIPGGPGGQLCLELDNKWTDTNLVIDGYEDLSGMPNIRWHQHISGIIIKGEIFYSFTEDSNGNGRLDRIRVQSNYAIKGDFSDFDVTVEGYVIDRTKYTNGFQMVSDETKKEPFDLDSFYIYLEENPEIDGGNTPFWSVTRNTSLLSVTGSKLGDPAIDKNIKPIDTIPPRIAYTLTIPGNPKTYVQMSEPVVSDSGVVSASFDGVSDVNAQPAVPANLGYLFNHSNSYGVDDLAKLPDIYNDTTSTAGNGYFKIENITDKEPKPNWSAINPACHPKYPLNWGYTEYAKVINDTSNAQSATSSTIPFSDVFTPPNKLLTVDMMTKLANGAGSSVTPNSSNIVIRRVTDVMISTAPANANSFGSSSDNYFVWPVWAKPQTVNTGTIWLFDGTAYLERDVIEKNNGIELQARIYNPQGGNLEFFWTTVDIPSDRRNPKEATEAKKVGGLWLPDVSDNPRLYYYVLPSDGINKKSAASSSALFNFDITADSIINGGMKFEFIFRFANSDMFAARLDAPPGIIPSNWYALIRPFSFDIQSMRQQRGGVTIMNNVINSDKKETAYIRYNLTRSGSVTIQIYTLDGTLVKSIKRNEKCDAGTYVDTWDGSNNGGRAVARGMYFVRVVGPDIDEIRKIMVVK